MMTTSQFDRLVEKVNKQFGVDMREETRRQHVVDIRQVFMKSLRVRGFKSTFIGRNLGKDHATVLHATKKINDLIQFDESIAVLVEHMDQIIDDFFISEQIYSKSSYIQKYEKIRVTAAELINRYTDEEEEIQIWLDRFDITWAEFRDFTSTKV